MKSGSTFIDLFAGIGGLRLGFEKAGFKCVYSSEIDEHARTMYKENFGEYPVGDIREVTSGEIPDFDVLLAGFPCQSFSIGGKQQGFKDATRGTLFFEICRILEYKQPKAFVLENVDNLEKHDKGNTFNIMLNSLSKLGYTVTYKVLNAKDYGVPQSRKRMILVGSLEGYSFDFTNLKQTKEKSIRDILESNFDFEYLDDQEYTLIDKEYVKKQKSGLIFVGYRNKKFRTNGVRQEAPHLSRVHKQPNRIYAVDGIHPTLISQESSGRYWVLVDERVRKLTILECYRLMGFPDSFKKVGKVSNLYKRIGNSVCVPMVTEIAEQVKEQFNL